jgi:hypothetical protein
MAPPTRLSWQAVVGRTGSWVVNLALSFPRAKGCWRLDLISGSALGRTLTPKIPPS